MKKLALFILIILNILPAFSQKMNSFSPKEKEYYNTIKGFCDYLEKNPHALEKRDTIFKSWVLFDYVLADTSESRKDLRIRQMDQLLAVFKHFIDSAGADNLDAAPIRYYKDSKEFFKPFAENLAEQVPVTFAYYDKNNPQHPIGYLLFDEKTGKLVSWVLINQGGHYYFLTFNVV
jgi:hypothetical protein